MTLRLTFSDRGPIQINFWRREKRMSEFRLHGNEAKNKNSSKTTLLGEICDKRFQTSPMSHFLSICIHLMPLRDYPL